MPKQPRSTKKEVDLSKLLPSLEELGEPSTTCLGKEYDINTTECKQCADHTLCLALYKHEVQVKVKSILPELPLADVADFSLITDEIQQRLLSVIQTYEQQGTPMQVMELFNTAKQLARCSDDVAVGEWVKRFILENYLITQNGNILKRK